jgi:hypothetical protein
MKLICIKEHSAHWGSILTQVQNMIVLSHKINIQ